MLIDTHTHLYVSEFDADRDETILRARQAGIGALLLPCIDEGSIGPMMKLCAQHPDLCYPMMGLHPTELPSDPESTLACMEQLLQDPSHPFVAVGEVGVDLYWDSSRREEQLHAFHTQALWACRYGLPLVVHSRNAHAEITQTLRPLQNQLHGGVFHCFGGTEHEALQLLEFPDFCLGIGGVVTFKKSTLPEVLSRAIPIERVVIETDSPYLAPTPHRGKRNESAYLPLVVQKLAEIYDLSVSEVEAITTRNALRVFKKVAEKFGQSKS